MMNNTDQLKQVYERGQWWLQLALEVLALTLDSR